MQYRRGRVVSTPVHGTLCSPMRMVLLVAVGSLCLGIFSHKLNIGIDHFFDQFQKGGSWLPIELLFRFAGIAKQEVLQREGVNQTMGHNNKKNSSVIGTQTTSAGRKNLGLTRTRTTPVSFSRPTSSTPVPSHLNNKAGK